MDNKYQMTEKEAKFLIYAFLCQNFSDKGDEEKAEKYAQLAADILNGK